MDADTRWLTMCKVCKDTFRMDPMEHLGCSHPNQVGDVGVDPQTKTAVIDDVYEQVDR